MRIDYCGFMIDGTPDEILRFVQLTQEQTLVARVTFDTETEHSPEPKHDPAPKPKNYKGLDVGKIKALRNAGWSLAKIADEMGCAPQTVANKLKEVGEK